MGPLSYLIAFVCIALGAYYWFNNQSSSPKSTTSSSSRTTTKSTNSLDFDKDCTIRALTPSDLTSVKALVNGQGGCGYFKDHSLTPYLDESDSKHLSFGVEHVSSGKIICAQFILMVDDNETGYVLGAMFDPKYKANIRVCYMRISNDIQDKLSTKFEDLGKHRTLVVEAVDDEDYKDDYCNNSVLDWRVKFNLDTMPDDNVYYLYNAQDDSGDDDGEDGVKVNGDFKETEDVDKAVTLLKGLEVENVMIDWRLFQTKCLKEVLEEDIKAKKLVLLVNNDETALVLQYGGSDFYVHGKGADAVLSGIRFALAQSTDLGIYVSKTMVGDSEEIKKVLGKAMNKVIVGLDYDMHIDGH